jgi:hypothetical protein
MNNTVKKKVNFINSSENEGLSPSCIALSFDGFGSISWHTIWVFFSALIESSQCFLDFQLFRPEYHWRDLSSRNAHLVHQNWYRISFTLKLTCSGSGLIVKQKYCTKKYFFAELPWIPHAFYTGFFNKSITQDFLLLQGYFWYGYHAINFN